MQNREEFSVQVEVVETSNNHGFDIKEGSRILLSQYKV